MSHFARQTIEKKHIKVWKVIMIIVVTVTAMNYSLVLSEGLGPIFSSIIGLSVIILGTFVCIKIIYSNLEEYDYRLIEKKIILERHIGRANNSLVTIPISSIESMVKYSDLENKVSVPRRHIFTNNSNKNDCYYIEYKEENKTKSVIFEPDESFLNCINSNT